LNYRREGWLTTSQQQKRINEKATVKVNVDVQAVGGPGYSSGQVGGGKPRASTPEGKRYWERTQLGNNVWLSAQGH